MKAKFLIFLYFVVLLFCLQACSPKQPQRHIMAIAGWLEQVRVQPSNILLHAKLDSGADSCSIHAMDIKFFRKSKEDWVSFVVKNRYGNSSELKRKVLRSVKIKTKSKGFQIRPVVSLGLCVDNVFEYVECNLVDRSHFEHPVLIGRNYLSGSFLINPSETYITNPTCSDE